MKKSLRIWSLFILGLFLFPILLKFLPSSAEHTAAQLLKEPKKIVYAANVFDPEVWEDDESFDENMTNFSKETLNESTILVYFTHNHEAYGPITKAKNGKVAVSHHAENITIFGEKLANQLEGMRIQTEVLGVDNMEVRKEQNQSFSKSYDTIRPFVSKAIQQDSYDLIIDLHRDSLGEKHTTLKTSKGHYAKVAFVIGMEHAQHQENEKKAIALQQEMEKRVPGITRPLIRKSGKGVDGKYNQDLHPNLILIELGGIENTEEELNRTIAILSESISSILSK